MAERSGPGVGPGDALATAWRDARCGELSELWLDRRVRLCPLSTFGAGCQWRRIRYTFLSCPNSGSLAALVVPALVIRRHRGRAVNCDCVR